MKTELRIFKHKKFLLLIAENSIEQKALDLIAHGKYEADKSQPITGELCSDDMFNPYLRFEV
jgi:hypothetical protein